MEHAIDYISREEKALSLNEFKELLQARLMHLQTTDTNSGERATCIHCSSTNTYKDFENVRKAFGQDKGVIAHHYYQSFSPDDHLTPEQAHQIGVELAKRMFPNYQVVIATHTDRSHLHNHIIVNSCNLVTGQKWYSNKKSLSDIRKESDRLCKQYGLSVIDKQSKYKGIDRTTYTLATKGKSWKVQLVKDLTEAVGCCTSKEEFIRFLQQRGYSVRYRDVHITIQKNGEKKGIRVDTLAKQFGEKFTKANLEKAMGYYSEPNVTEQRPSPEYAAQPEPPSNWERYEQQIFKMKRCLPSVSGHITYHKGVAPALDRASSIAPDKNFSFLFRTLLLLTALFARKRKKQPKHTYQVRREPIPRIPSGSYYYTGNVPYKTLTESAGETLTIRVGIDRLLQLMGQPILYSARIDRTNCAATITIKKKDQDFLAEILNLVEVRGRLVEQSDRIQNRLTYSKLKESAERAGTKLQYLIVTAEQKQELEQQCQEFAYFEKEDGKFNIAFLPEQAEIIKRIAFPKPKTETAAQKNSRIYAELKRAATEAGEKLLTKTKLNKAQLDELQKRGIPFAYFVNQDDTTRYNVSFRKADQETVRRVLETAQQRNSRIYAELKRAATESGEKVVYRTKLTSAQLKQIQESGVKLAYFQNKEDAALYNIAFAQSDELTVKEALNAADNQKKRG